MTKFLVWPDTIPQSPDDEAGDIITITGWAIIPYRPEDPPVNVEFYRHDSGMVVYEQSLLLGPGDYDIPAEVGEDLDPEKIGMRIVTISGQSTEVHLNKETRKK